MKLVETGHYLGGHPQHPGKTIGVRTLIIDADHVQVKQFRAIVDIPRSEIRAVHWDGPDTIERRVTMTRLLSVGLFAFAAKKKRKQAGYITVEADSGSFVFEVESKRPAELAAKVRLLAAA